MTIALEYIVCQLQVDDTSVAIKSHKNRNQNPGLNITVGKNEVEFNLVGLSVGTVEEADPSNPAATRLDFYIGLNDLRDQMGDFPEVHAGPSDVHLSITDPTGTERLGGKRISWRGSLAKVPILGARMVFPDGNYVADTVDEVALNIDREPAPYPLSSGGRAQVHIGVEAVWSVTRDRRRTIPTASIRLSRASYAEVASALREVTSE